MATLVTWTLVLMAAGGFIAWAGDRLGTRIGKKRMSLLGLRPRHTAMVGTIGAGVVIALLTLLALFGYDRSVRRALLHGREIIHQNAVLSGRNRQYQAQIAAAENRLQPLTQQLSDARTALAQQQAQMNAAERQLSGARTALQTTQAQLHTARQGVTQAQKSLTLARNETRRQQAAAVMLAAQGTELRLANARLKQASAQLALRAEASRGDLLFRGRTARLPEGQELGRIVIRASQPVRTIEQQIDTFLDGLSRMALTRGGRRGASGRAITVAILPPGSDSFRALSPEGERQAVRALAQNIAGGNGSVVLIAHAPVNSFRGELSEVALRAYDNVLVYAKDTLIAAQPVDGTQSETQVLGALQSFLTEKVRPAALKRGLIPENDPQTGRLLVGAVDEATSLGLVQQIRQIGSTVLVSAYADDDVFSSGPLRLRLTASPAAP